ncbi:MAG: hypothetical protein ACP6IS_10040 [Candidatus Asgardarchaeia archaeon]
MSVDDCNLCIDLEYIRRDYGFDIRISNVCPSEQPIYVEVIYNALPPNFRFTGVVNATIIGRDLYFSPPMKIIKNVDKFIEVRGYFENNPADFEVSVQFTINGKKCVVKKSIMLS